MTFDSARNAINGLQQNGFVEIHTFKHNHTTVGKKDTGDFVLQYIRSNIEVLLP